MQLGLPNLRAGAKPVVVAGSGERGAWIVSRRYDLVFFVAGALVPMALWGLYELHAVSAVAVYVIFQFTLNMPHNGQTWTLSFLDGADRRKHGRRYLVALAIVTAVLAVPLLLSPSGVYPWIRDALIYWGYYHLLRQHYGLQRLYERRMALAGAPVTARESSLYTRLLQIVSFAPLVLRFRDPELMTIRGGPRTFWIHHPSLPPIAYRIVLAVYLTTIVAAILHHLVAAIRGRRHLLPRALFLMSVTICLGIAAGVVENVLVSVSFFTSYHCIQYLGLVWFHNRNRADLAERDSSPRGLNIAIDWVRSGWTTRYAILSLLYGVLLFVPVIVAPTNPSAQLPVSIAVAMHYYVDSRLWRFQDYPQLARFLKLKGERDDQTVRSP